MEQIKRVSGAGDLDQGIEAEKGAFATAFRSADAREGIAAFLAKRRPNSTALAEERGATPRADRAPSPAAPSSPAWPR